jgi:hypothetical protein
MIKIFLVALTLSFSLSAREWQRIEVPGAVCGNGYQYSIFVDIKPNSEKLLVEFMPGGACWSTWSCYGPRFRTWIHQMPKLPAFSVIGSGNPEVSPVADHSAIYFPYCTGDVYAGRHVARYQTGARVHHQGHQNVTLAFEHLRDEGIIPFDKIEELTFYGASAGAIGALIHGKRIYENYVPKAQKRRIISDSPGLHFGPTFWEKFPEQLFDDIRQALADVDFVFDENDGFVAPNLPRTCKFYSDFSIGILQGSQDLVMAYLFGEINHWEHEKLVYSDLGLYEQTKSTPNCAAWVPSTKHHTFLVLPMTADYEAGPKSTSVDAMSFAKKIIQGKTDTNYR